MDGRHRAIQEKTADRFTSFLLELVGNLVFNHFWAVSGRKEPIFDKKPLFRHFEI